MKAVVTSDTGPPEVMNIEEVETPSPKHNEVLVEVKATSVNRADIIQRQGNYPPPGGESEILGLEASGLIARAGTGAKEWKIGERVMGLVAGGGYAQYVVIHKDHLISIPETMSYEEAACVCEAYITAFLNIFIIGGHENGKTVLLHGGGGGVNTAAIQLCRHLAPEGKVIVTASSAKIKRIYQLGADLVVNYQEKDFASEVRNFTINKGVDLILDHIGAAYLEANLKCLAVDGRLIIIGLMGGAESRFNLGHLMVKRQSIIGSVLRSRSLEDKSRIIKTFQTHVMPLFYSRKIVPIIHRVFPITEVRKAHQEMENSLHFGKIVLNALDFQSNKK